MDAPEPKHDRSPGNGAGEPLVRIEGLRKSLGGRDILLGVDLEIPPGQTLAILGPSGCGKTTLLRAINGLAPFDAGRITVGGHRLTAGRPRGAARAALVEVRRVMGMIFQDFQLFPHLTALQNVIEAPQYVLRTPLAEARALGRELLARVGLEERIDHYPAQLSGGQKQRVAIARALAMSPRGLLCDEITSALDPQNKQEVLEIVMDLKREGMTLVVVTHEIGFARRAADRIVVLDAGQIIEDGPPAQVLDHPQHPRTLELLEHAGGL